MYVVLFPFVSFAFAHSLFWILHAHGQTVLCALVKALGGGEGGCESALRTGVVLKSALHHGSWM